MFRSERFRYAFYRARLAARRGRHDEAAAFAHGALWQLEEDDAGPQFSRHPGVGRVRAGRRTLQRGYAAEGDAERYDGRIDDPLARTLIATSPPCRRSPS